MQKQRETGGNTGDRILCCVLNDAEVRAGMLVSSAAAGTLFTSRDVTTATLAKLWHHPISTAFSATELYHPTRRHTVPHVAISVRLHTAGIACSLR